MGEMGMALRLCVAGPFGLKLEGERPQEPEGIFSHLSFSILPLAPWLSRHLSMLIAWMI